MKLVDRLSEFVLDKKKESSQTENRASPKKGPPP